MSTPLPHGLITIGCMSVPNDKEPHPADVLFERSHVLHSFWKVHAIRYSVSKDVSDFRCQNLFWRTWGDAALSKTITTPTLTTLWSQCQQSIGPTTLRKSTISLPPRRTGSRPQDLPTSPQISDSLQPGSAASVKSSLFSSSTTTGIVSTPASSSRDRATSVDDIDDLDITVDDEKKDFKSPRPGLHRAGSTTTRTSFGASSSRLKARPSLNRRKSSQAAPQSKPIKLVKSVPKSPVFSPHEMAKIETPPSTTTTSTFKLPSASSWEDEPTGDLNKASTPTSNMASPPELVEPNFRNKFAERIASSSNLTTISRIKKTGSVVRFADEVPQDQRKVKDKEELFYGLERRPSLIHRSSIASVAIIDEDEASLPELTRTKSQLSMLIDESRAQGGRRDTEHTSSDLPVGLSSRRKKEPTEAEKVLSMAHGEGFTRAGGRQIRRGFKFQDEDESRYSSPSPPPIF